MERARVLLAGPGKVGSAFLRLAERRDDLEVVAVVGRSGRSVAEHLSTGAWDVVADATPTDLETGGPALANARVALGRGIHFATAAKGPLVCAYRELQDLSERHGVGFRFSAATGASLPTVDTVEFAFAGAKILSFEGVVNDTSNFVLDRMAEGMSMPAALAAATAVGIVDGDGRPDLSGADTASKIVGIANAIWSADLRIADAEIDGIYEISAERIAQVARRGGAVRIVGSARRDGAGVVHVAVGPRELEPGDPLLGVPGFTKTITYTSDTMGKLTLAGGQSDPLAAGAALLRDVLLLLRVGARPSRSAG